jgi:hypothetical protein
VLAREHASKPGAGRDTLALGPAHYAADGNDQQTPQGSFPHAGRSTEPLLAASRLLQRGEADPGGEVPTGAEGLGRRRKRLDRRSDQRPNPRHRHKAPSNRVLLGACSDLPIECLGLVLREPQHLDKPDKTGACRVRDARRSRPFVAGLRSSGLVAPLALDGSMTGEVFRGYVEQMLAPALQPGDVVVMDNLAAHKVAGVREAIRAAGASVLYSYPQFSRCRGAAAGKTSRA